MTYQFSCVKIKRAFYCLKHADNSMLNRTNLCTSCVYLFCSLILILIIRLVFFIRWIIFLKRNVHELRRLQQNRRKVTTFYRWDKELHSNGALPDQRFLTEEISWSSERKETTEKCWREQRNYWSKTGKAKCFENVQGDTISMTCF